MSFLECKYINAASASIFNPISEGVPLDKPYLRKFNKIKQKMKKKWKNVKKIEMKMTCIQYELVGWERNWYHTLDMK